MNKLIVSAAAAGMFLALPMVQGLAADQRALTPAGTFNPGIGQGGIIAPRPPVLTQPIYFSCEKGSCSCKNSVDCGEMGRLGVCKTGTFKENKTGGGSCTMKPA